MSGPKKILLVMPHMIGGGAERVGAQLMNAFAEKGFATEVVLTADRPEDVIRCDLKDATPLTLLREQLPAVSARDRLKYGVLLKNIAQVFCNLFELFRRPVPADLAKASLYVQYHREIAWLREKLRREPDTAVIAFLQPVIPVVMLAARGLPNRVVFSERGNPQRLMQKRYGRKFVGKYYLRADAAVFQTEAARAVYPAAVAAKGVVIPNPLKAGLPAPCGGEREKRIVTFCRISPEKNLTLLVDAFARFRDSHPDFTLAIYGDAANAEGARTADALRAQIRERGLEDAASLQPFSPTVHTEILRCTAYVNSSDTEGLSNAMLEAMAIGLPCVCTDCPIGGARAAITDGENGLLVPVGDADALAGALRRIADEPALREKLAQNAAGVRERLALPAVADRWLALLQ